MELHDIFPQMPIIEYSLYTFLALSLVGLVLLYLLYKILKNKRKQMHPLHILECYNANDAKQAAHQVSYYGKQLAKSEAQKLSLASLEKKLNAFKYLETSHSLSSELQEEIERFIHSIRYKNV